MTVTYRGKQAHPTSNLVRVTEVHRWIWEHIFLVIKSEFGNPWMKVSVLINFKMG